MSIIGEIDVLDSINALDLVKLAALLLFLRTIGLYLRIRRIGFILNM